VADIGFLLRDATRVLVAENLLAYVLAPSNGRLAPSRPGTQAGAIRGADLDSRRVRAGQLFVALPGEHTDGRRFAGAALARGATVLAGLPDGAGGTRRAAAGADAPVAASEDFSATATAAATADEWHGAESPIGTALLVSPDPQRALQILAAHWRNALKPVVVGVTGSNGKTTTKDFLAALLGGSGPTLATRGNLNNELGLPLTLLDLRPEHRHAVIEMGASAEGEIARLAALAGPSIGVITNAAEAHLAEFGSLAGIIRGKGELLDALPADGTAVLNAESPGFTEWRDRAPCPVVSWGREAGDHRWRWEADPARGGGRLHLDDEAFAIPLPGRYNGANLCAALLAARAAGAPAGSLRRGLQDFRASPHRSRLLRLGGWTVLDDSYNANPTSLIAAAEALLALAGSRSLAVVGAMAELGPRSEEIHRAAGGALRSAGIDRLVAVGALAGPLAEGFDAAGGEAHLCADHDEAADWILAHARSGDRILIKGSRSSGMEAVVARLEATTGAEPAADPPA